ncbi:MAG TPA: VIT1/CCC1 transporter family protein [Aliidongia sp.]|uniref:VIT1/CCC1 transporter family protein n=1 Tax=Aliidongia sp. TaxID=1914230 RepID=UPI002DDDB975|nr:VIT1/CCC1 transporter family protein [Aliidongia sp.]HEV2675312.1 VIT1/CCC1 transporter family protein [Aliidongia sp.]
MPAAHHHERHFMASDAVRDVVIGMSDGLTVPFALAAGLSAALSRSSVVVTAGLAEIAAGAIAMGLGGYLAARTDIEHYRSEYRREWRETEELPDEERREVAAILREQGLDAAQADTIVTALSRNKEKWVRFMMRFELGLEEPDPKRAPRSAATIGVSYIVGGLVPLLPYLLLGRMEDAFRLSVCLTLLALLVFGAVKGWLTGVPSWRAGLQTVLVGGLAAGAAFGIARMVADL